MLSAGLLPYRRSHGALEILIAHPGGPFWAGRHAGSWSVVKGGVEWGEDAYDAAVREFIEETGWTVDPADPIDLGEVVQRSGKRVRVWGFEADFDPESLDGDTITMYWRGRLISFPEIDEVRWVGSDEAGVLLNPAQALYYERLKSLLDEATHGRAGGTVAT